MLRNTRALLWVGLLLWGAGMAYATPDEVEDRTERLLGLSIEDLLEVDVISASKHVERVKDAPSNITVVTAQEIKEWGAKDLKDVLRRIAGYYMVADRDEWVFAARGNVSDNNQEYLLLIDGHRMNSFENFGPGQIIELPNDLSNVKQIEIIRGPGSAMWGSGGLAGVINILTIEPSDLEGDKARASVTLGKGDMQRANFQVAREVSDEVGWIVSGAFSSERGQLIQQSAATTLPIFDQQRTSPVDNTSNNTVVDHPRGSYTTALERRRPGYMLQLKSRIEKWRLNAMAFETMVHNRHFEVGKNRENFLATQKQFIEGLYDTTLEGDIDMTWKISSSTNQSEYFPYAYAGAVDVNKLPFNIVWQDRTFESSLDFMKSFNSHADLKWGAEFAWAKFGPNQRINSFNPQTPKASTTGFWFDPYLEEHNYSGYIMATLSPGVENLKFVLGSRFDYNEDRGTDEFNASPRMGLIYHASENTTFKGLYNRGFFRPANFQATTPNPTNPLKSEIMDQVDLIWMQRFGRASLTTTLYWQRLQGLINIIGSLGGGFANAGDYESTGIEGEFRTPLGEDHSLWANASYCRATAYNFPSTDSITDVNDMIKELNRRRIDGDGKLLSYPAFMFNLGTTLRFLERKFFVAPALRFTGEVTYRTRPPYGSTLSEPSLNQPIHQKVGPFTYLDISVGYEPTKQFGLYAVLQNALNERSPTHLSIWNGTIEQYGSYFELRAMYRFK